ncbi:unnamed protein product [Musa acuminata subsp. malaccensis]|uniref:(wild Malaysian banana) hypothetical protein n=1 Tax=Musa acuminata subsp. malaccensis TaxID=214687 RepID=A0A804I4J4_MUSAM|nr:unnamed protein product [Musa acuminata subsp. malaccensis]
MCSGRSMRASVGGLAWLLCLGLFISACVVGGGTNATPPVTVPIVASSRDRPLGDRSLDPLRASKRRVPNGPDPIHNRRAGRFGRPPVRA